MRGLTPLLRELGDRHGNLVVAAVPNKHIMVKGPQDRIKEAKAGLRALVEEHFPDAPIPKELDCDGEEAKAMPASTTPSPEVSMSPQRVSVQQMKSAFDASTSPSPRPRKTSLEALRNSGRVSQSPLVRKDSRTKVQTRIESPEEPAKGAQKQEDSKKVTIRKRPRSANKYPSTLLWECMRQNSSFIRKPCRELHRRWSAEPGNLLSLHTARFSGLANYQVLDVRPVKRGAKEGIELVQSHAKSSKMRQPRRAFVTRGLSKCLRKGAEQLTTEIVSKYYCRNLVDLARSKYVRTRLSFRKKRKSVKSRRAVQK